MHKLCCSAFLGALDGVGTFKVVTLKVSLASVDPQWPLNSPEQRPPSVEESLRTEANHRGPACSCVPSLHDI